MTVEEVIARAIAAQMQQSQEQFVYSEKEAAELLKLSARALADERKAGRIKAFRGAKNRPLYTRETIQDWLHSRPFPRGGSR